MNLNFEKIKNYLLELDFDIVQANEEEGVLVIDKEEEGIKNAVLILAEPIVIVEQFIFDIGQNTMEVYKKLLVKNRDIIHGAFALDESGERVLFRNTHECENLDINELEATLNSLAMLLSEYANEIIAFSK